MVKTAYCQCRERKFNPWSKNYVRYHVLRGTAKKQKLNQDEFFSFNNKFGNNCRHTQRKVCVCVWVPHPTFALMIDIKGRRGAWKTKRGDPRLTSCMNTSF